MTRTCGSAFAPLRGVWLLWRRRQLFVMNVIHPCSSNDGIFGQRLSSRLPRFGTL